MYKELVDNLREHADWAAANEWETPITLGDDLAQAADAIDKLQSELEREKRELEERNRGCEYCYTDAKSNPFVGGYNYCPMCGRRLSIYVTKDTNFCPNYGAKMDLEAQHD